MEVVEDNVLCNSEKSWRGVNINAINKNLPTTLFPPVKSSSLHTVTVELPLTPNEVPRPFKKNTDESWTPSHVHLPFSNKSLFPAGKTASGQNNLRKRWEVIQEALLQPINSSRDFERAVCSYNNNRKWKFPALHTLFEKELEASDSQFFFKHLLPKIIRLALRLPSLLQCGVPLLKARINHSVTLSQLQIAALLANAFLCTFPRRNSDSETSQYSNFPCINFSRLFQAQSNCVIEKLKCLINYFNRVTTQEPKGLVTYSRRYVPTQNLPNWNESKMNLPEFFISSEGMIENQEGLLQVDFANKYIGGGVLGYGGVQEEIRFVICPELIVAQLFCECLDSTEAVVITGVERYNDYSGYSSTFTWTGNHVDTTPYDAYQRRCCTLVAIDATNVARNPKAQYTTKFVERELNKAYVGFSWGKENLSSNHVNTIATGNWGCGAFKGDVELKAMIQIMAAGQSNCNICYFTFGNLGLTNSIYEMYMLLKYHNVHVRRLYRLIVGFGEHLKNEDNVSDCMTLYEFMFKNIVRSKVNIDLYSPVKTEDIMGKSSTNSSRKLLNDVNNESSTAAVTSDIFDSPMKDISEIIKSETDDVTNTTHETFENFSSKTKNTAKSKLDILNSPIKNNREVNNTMNTLKTAVNSNKTKNTSDYIVTFNNKRQNQIKDKAESTKYQNEEKINSKLKKINKINSSPDLNQIKSTTINKRHQSVSSIANNDRDFVLQYVGSNDLLKNNLNSQYKADCNANDQFGNKISPHFSKNNINDKIITQDIMVTKEDSKNINYLKTNALGVINRNEATRTIKLYNDNVNDALGNFNLIDNTNDKIDRKMSSFKTNSKCINEDDHFTDSLIEDCDNEVPYQVKNYIPSFKKEIGNIGVFPKHVSNRRNKINNSLKTLNNFQKPSCSYDQISRSINSDEKRDSVVNFQVSDRQNDSINHRSNTKVSSDYVIQIEDDLPDTQDVSMINSSIIEADSNNDDCDEKEQKNLSDTEPNETNRVFNTKDRPIGIGDLTNNKNTHSTKYTQELFSEDEEMCDVSDVSCQNKVYKTRDIFSEDEEVINSVPVSNSGRKKSSGTIHETVTVSKEGNFKFNRDSIKSKSPNKVNELINSTEVSEMESRNLVTITEQNKTNLDLKKVKKTQRNSWLYLESSKKDLKSDEIEKNLQIMDTSDDTMDAIDDISNSKRENIKQTTKNSPKIRKTDKNLAFKNKKITDYFVKK